MGRCQISEATLLPCQHYQELHDIFERGINKSLYLPVTLYNQGWSPHGIGFCRSDHHSSLHPVKNSCENNEQQITPITAQDTTFSESLVSGRKKNRQSTLRPGFVASKEDADTSALHALPEALHVSCHFASKHRENRSSRIIINRYDMLKKIFAVIHVLGYIACKHCY